MQTTDACPLYALQDFWLTIIVFYEKFKFDCSPNIDIPASLRQIRNKCSNWQDIPDFW